MRNERGLTLIEILAAIAIISIIFIPMSTFIVQAFRINYENELSLNTHSMAVSIIEDLKMAAEQFYLFNEKTYTIAGQLFRLDNESANTLHTEYTDETVEINDHPFSLSFRIEPFDSSILPEQFKKNEIKSLYEIWVKLIPLNSNVETITEAELRVIIDI